MSSTQRKTDVHRGAGTCPQLVPGPRSGPGDVPAAAPADPALTFPDPPKLELDLLLSQLVERAQEVMATQSRLRGLLRANQVVSSDLALPAVLRHIVEAARELVDARYAALSIISPVSGLAEFVQAGVPPDAVAGIEQLSEAEGLLGVPIRIRDEVFGNLYLSESADGAFSDEDEELAKALAATAAVAIGNAHLYASARSRGEWLRASAEIVRQLLAPDHAGAAGPLQLIGERSREIAVADLVMIALPAGGPTGADADDELIVDLAVGVGAEDLPGLRLPVLGSLSGRAFSTGEPQRADVAGPIDGYETSVVDGVDVGPALAVPLRGATRVHGVLWMARLRGGAVFTAADSEMAATFANQAAVAIELGEARAAQQRSALLDDRDLIAAELRDHVIQRLFAAGLSLQSVAAQLGRGPLTERIMATVDDLDGTIDQIRTSVFRLHDRPDVPTAGSPAR